MQKSINIFAETRENILLFSINKAKAVDSFTIQHLINKFAKQKTNCVYVKGGKLCKFIYEKACNKFPTN